VLTALAALLGIAATVAWRLVVNPPLPEEDARVRPAQAEPAATRAEFLDGHEAHRFG